MPLVGAASVVLDGEGVVVLGAVVDCSGDDGIAGAVEGDGSHEHIAAAGDVELGVPLLDAEGVVLGEEQVVDLCAFIEGGGGDVEVA